MTDHAHTTRHHTEDTTLRTDVIANIHALEASCPDPSVQEYADAALAGCLPHLHATQEALAELVRLKDGPRDDNYRASKDDAWAAARTALTPPGPDTPAVAARSAAPAAAGTVSAFAAELDGHRQEHQPATGASTCTCGTWAGPFTLHVTDPRSYPAHLASVLLASSSYADALVAAADQALTDAAAAPFTGTVMSNGRYGDGFYAGWDAAMTSVRAHSSGPHADRGTR